MTVVCNGEPGRMTRPRAAAGQGVKITQRPSPRKGTLKGLKVEVVKVHLVQAHR